jgi:hypothetical protein
MKYRLVGAELFHADGRVDGWTDGQTDMMKLLVTFRNFVMRAPKKFAFQFSLYSCLDSNSGSRKYVTLSVPTFWAIKQYAASSDYIFYFELAITHKFKWQVAEQETNFHQRKIMRKM